MYMICIYSFHRFVILTNKLILIPNTLINIKIHIINYKLHKLFMFVVAVDVVVVDADTQKTKYL